MNNSSYFTAVIIFLLIYSFVPKCFSQYASFQSLGDFPGGIFESSAQSVSDDGSVVAGYGITDSGQQAFRWTQSTGMKILGNLPDSSLKISWVNDISADGRVIVGGGDTGSVRSYAEGDRGFRWNAESGMIAVDGLNGSTRSEAWGVSADGSVIVGDGGVEAFRWTQSGGIIGLGVLPNWLESRAMAVSENGLVVTGSCWSARNGVEEAFRWTEESGMQAMGYLSSGTWGTFSFPNAISPDGSVIAGTSSVGSTATPFRWIQSSGMVSIGHLPGMNRTHPSSVSAYGKIIVGTSSTGSDDQIAFIWDSTNGIQNLKTVLQNNYGLNLTGWTLRNAFGITPDGNVIVGWGTNPSGNSEAFRVVLDTLETVTDIDGNVYQTVKIGTQVWMKENLKTTRYRNGDTIGTTHPAPRDYHSETMPKYQWAYDGNESNAEVYGRLYTWDAVNDSRNIAPKGWHVASDAEWTTLVNFLGGAGIAGAKLKEAGTVHWKSPNNGTNESGFTGLPAGSRYTEGLFMGMGEFIHFWTSTELEGNKEMAWRWLLYSSSLAERGSCIKVDGWSVRCLKDATTGVDDSKDRKHIPDEIKLNQNYPNPFNPSTVISYRLSASSKTNLTIYNVLGQKIKTLINFFQSAGEHSVIWDATDNSNNPVSSGIYFYKMETNGSSIQKKMILIR